MGLLTLPVLNQAGHLVALGPSDVCPAQLPPGWLPGVHVLLAQTLWHLQPAPEHYLPSLVISKYLLSCRPEEKAPSGMRRGCRGTRGGSPLPRRVWLTEGAVSGPGWVLDKVAVGTGEAHCGSG